MLAFNKPKNNANAKDASATRKLSHAPVSNKGK
jgi:hypothetical protein